MLVARLLDVDGDFFRHDRRIEGHVVLVTQLQLQGVLAGCQRHLGFGLCLAEMHVIGVYGNNLPRSDYLCGVDQQVVVTGVLGGVARWRQRNVLDSELDPEGLRNSPTVFRRHDGHFSALGSWRRRTGQHRNTHQQASQSST
ncbi:hypothetical protein D3C81_1776310 [compost metagenome]